MDKANWFTYGGDDYLFPYKGQKPPTKEQMAEERRLGKLAHIKRQEENRAELVALIGEELADKVIAANWAPEWALG